MDHQQAPEDPPPETIREDLDQQLPVKELHGQNNQEGNDEIQEAAPGNAE
jgi:hypothetical protein